MTDFAALVRDAAKRSKLKPTFTLIHDTWSAVVGDDVAVHVRPVRLDGKTLTLGVRDHWKREWERRSNHLLANTQRFFPQIKEIQFEVASFDEPHSLPQQPDLTSTQEELLERVQRLRELVLTDEE